MESITLTTLSHLRLVVSDDGVRFTEDVSRGPMMGQGELESYGIEDRRITQIGSMYYLTFTAVSPHGVGVGMRSTSDWQAMAAHGMIFSPHNKDCALFEARIERTFITRCTVQASPVLGGNYLWLAESPDLLHWGNHRCLAHPRPGMWDSVRLGAGAAPIRTSGRVAGNLSRGGCQASLLSRRIVAGLGRTVEGFGAFARSDHGTDRRL